MEPDIVRAAAEYLILNLTQIFAFRDRDERDLPDETAQILDAALLPSRLPVHKDGFKRVVGLEHPETFLLDCILPRAGENGSA
jgi:hypothetical protein